MVGQPAVRTKELFLIMLENGAHVDGDGMKARDMAIAINSPLVPVESSLVQNIVVRLGRLRRRGSVKVAGTDGRAQIYKLTENGERYAYILLGKRDRGEP